MLPLFYKSYCSENKINTSIIPVDSLEKAKDLPCVFNNWGAFYKGKFVSVNLLDVETVEIKPDSKVEEIVLSYWKFFD